MARLTISLACCDYDRTRAIFDGRVRVEGCEVVGIAMSPEEAFHRAFKYQEFDVTELSMSSYMNVQSYYVFFHDLVAGVEDLRTTLRSGLTIEKCVRGVTAGYNTPTFVGDTLGGGGKRDAHSYEVYDEENGIAIFSSPTVRPGELFYYFDPLDTLSDEARTRWVDERTR